MKFSTALLCTSLTFLATAAPVKDAPGEYQGRGGLSSSEHIRPVDNAPSERLAAASAHVREDMSRYMETVKGLPIWRKKPFRTEASLRKWEMMRNGMTGQKDRLLSFRKKSIEEEQSQGQPDSPKEFIKEEQSQRRPVIDSKLPKESIRKEQKKGRSGSDSKAKLPKESSRKEQNQGRPGSDSKLAKKSSKKEQKKGQSGIDPKLPKKSTGKKQKKGRPTVPPHPKSRVSTELDMASKKREKEMSDEPDEDSDIDSFYEEEEEENDSRALHNRRNQMMHAEFSDAASLDSDDESLYVDK